MANCEKFEVIVYTRKHCHLCEEALEVLAKHRLRAKTIDIDSDEVLLERYNECVPVVVINGKERFRGRVHEVLLRRILVQGMTL